MAKQLTWLHLSDIHFHPQNAWRDNVAHDKLLRYLSDISCKPDLIFCTGDIAFGNLPKASISNQYAKAKLFFDELLRVCGNLQKERLFIVPGNHDVNRSATVAEKEEHIRQASIEELTSSYSNKDAAFRYAIKRLEAYSKFIEEYLPHQKDIEGRHYYTKTELIAGYQVGIAGFNSAWTCSGKEDERKICLPAEWQFNQAYTALKDADIRIGLIHHPIDWLRNEDQLFAKRSIPTAFDFWLHGHIHDAWVTSTQKNHTEIVSGAIGAENATEFGINIVQLDLEVGTGKVFLHTYDKHNWIAQNIAPHAPQGVWDIVLSDHIRKIDHGAGANDQQVKTNPYNPWQPATEQCFFGQSNQLEYLRKALQENRSVSVIGDWRIGKTSLLKNWSSEVQATGRRVLFVSGESEERVSCAALVSQITRIKLPQSESVENCIHVLKNWAESHEDSPLVLMDEADYFLVNFPLDFFSSLRHLVSVKKLCLVLATRQPLGLIYKQNKLTTAQQQCLPVVQDLYLGLLERASAEAIIQLGNFDDVGQNFMRACAGRHPYFLSLIGWHLWDTNGNVQEAELSFYGEAKNRLEELWTCLNENEKNGLIRVSRGEESGVKSLMLRGLTYFDGKQERVFGEVFAEWIKENHL